MENWSVLAWPVRWWGRQSLRARLTLITTAIFSIAVLTGVVLVLQLQRFALLRVLDSSAQKSANDIVTQLQARPDSFDDVVPTTGGVTRIQIVNEFDEVLGQHRSKLQQPLLNPMQLTQARAGARIDISDPTNGLAVRVVAAKYGTDTVLVVTDVTRVEDSVRALERVAFVGGPLAVLLMGLATYLVCALTLKPVGELRHGAADITAAGLSEKRLPVPNARDEIHRLAVTLNAMLDRIDSATSKQRTFVGDAAHELRSPLASLRVQLEVAQRIGPDESWQVLVDDVLEDVSRLERLVEDLLALARADESSTQPRRSVPVELDALLQQVSARYEHARLPVTLGTVSPAVVQGDPDGLLRVVVNLTDNALRYAVTGVTVGLDVHRANGRGSATAVVTVTDDGPGIPPEERDRVFDRFYRLEQSRSRESGGTGLGLAIAQDLAHSHGGAIVLRDRADGSSGLVAEVSLPLPD